VVDKAMATLSDQLMLATVVLYLVAVLGYAADLAFGGRAARSARTDGEAASGSAGAGERAVPALATAGGTSTVSAAAGADAAGTGPASTVDVDDAANAPEATDAQGAGATATGETRDAERPGGAVEDGAAGASDTGVDWGRFAVLITVFGWVAHLAEIVTRGLAAHRVPWANMYEFASAIVFAAVTVYLVVLARKPIRSLGVFVTLLSVLGLGVAAIWLYTEAGPVIPALRSYWIAIHVSLAIASTGLFTLATVSTVLYLGPVRRRPDWLPARDALDRIAH
jgi:hypothetical protein